MKHLTERGHSFSATAEGEIARVIKKKPCHIGADYDSEPKSTAETDKGKIYELPDGNNIITVGAKRFHCASQVSPVEEPAEPTTLLSEQHEMRRRNPQRVVRHCRVISDTTMFQQILERMTKEPTASAPSTMNFRIFKWLLHQRVWIGGYISLSFKFSADVDLEGRDSMNLTPP